jgi:hypothetical protein
MKNLLFVLILFYSQESYAQPDSVNFYKECFERHLNKYHKGKVRNIFLQETAGITDEISENIFGISIIKLDDSRVRNRVKKGSFVMLQIFPIVIKNNEIKLEIVEFSVLFKDGKTNLVRHGGSSYTIGFSDGKYKITDEYHQGI